MRDIALYQEIKLYCLLTYLFNYFDLRLMSYIPRVVYPLILSI